MVQLAPLINPGVSRKYKLLEEAGESTPSPKECTINVKKTPISPIAETALTFEQKKDSVDNQGQPSEVQAPKTENSTPPTDKFGPLYVATWFFLNVFLAILMKAVFSNSSFKFPVIMSSAHMIVGTILSQIVLRSGAVDEGKPIDAEGTKRLRYFVFLFCLNIAFGNIAVKIVNLPLSQIVRSTIPLFIMALAFLIQGVIPTLYVALSVVPIVAGVAMTAYGDVELTVISLALLMIGNIFAGLKVVITNKYLTQYKLHPMVMLAKLSPLATVVMLSFALMNGEIASFSKVYQDISATTYMWVIVSGIMSFGLNWTNFLANRHTSPLTMSVLGNLKQVILVFSSVYLFNTQMAMLATIGASIATAGMMLFSYIKFIQSQSKVVKQ
ncbi:hypothetical protein AKO1_007443 [Acrasis kona]|uniref:Sugar phosphate transporter domain-containing protein n=1 Tax=Acrasis kona TaxID=1008807 RepID=A0AAW2YRY8_9EUKA